MDALFDAVKSGKSTDSDIKIVKPKFIAATICSVSQNKCFDIIDQCYVTKENYCSRKYQKSVRFI